MSSDDDEVGYGKPPKKNQFKKGQSGNRKGRPKGSHSLMTMFAKRMDRRVTVRKGDVEKSMTYRELLLEKTFKDAIEGDAKARMQVFTMDERCRVAAEERERKLVTSSVDQEQTLGQDELEFLPMEMLDALLVISTTLRIIKANLPKLHQMRAEEKRLDAARLEDLQRQRMPRKDE